MTSKLAAWNEDMLTEELLTTFKLYAPPTQPLKDIDYLTPKYMSK